MSLQWSIRFGLLVLTVVLVAWARRKPLRWGRFKSAAFATAVAGVFATLATLLSANGLSSYGASLFLALPAAAGLLAVLVHSVSHRPTLRDVGALSASVTLGAAMVAACLAIEGFVCLAMASPLVFVLVLAGALFGERLVRLWLRLSERNAMPAVLAVVLLGVPGAIEVEARLPRVAPTYEVSTAADINAPPPLVWQAVISPSKLPKPTHPIFRAGIAYPLAAHIEGSGPGATRYCNFSTGNLVEPVLEWNEPRLLRFSVISNPQPMQEWTLYGQIHPPHLDGFLVSRQGEFRLEPLPGGRTRLIATTWYQHNLYPAAYWRLWSDYILHRVHDVVLDNIGTKARAAHQMRDASSTNPGRTGSPETVSGSSSTTGAEPGR